MMIDALGTCEVVGDSRGAYLVVSVDVNIESVKGDFEE